MEVLYEESALNQKAKKQKKFYGVVNVIFWIAVVVSIWLIVDLVFNMIPFKGPETKDEEYQLAWINFLGQLIFVLLVVSFALFAYFIKRKINVSYDYTFVSGELRISRVFNVNKRKYLCTIYREEIMQVGDVEGAHFERLSNDPATKTIIHTPNNSPAEDKFFMYILIKAGAQKQLHVLECREELLINVIKFAKRGVLEDGYISQEVKKAEMQKAEERQRLAQEVTDGGFADLNEQEMAAMRAATGEGADEE